MAGPEDKALDQLYSADLDEFTARRNELSKKLRDAGDADAADRLTALKKPSRAAWALNRLGDRKPKLRNEVLKAGAALREAQERLVAGDADRTVVRKATEGERKAVGKALEAAQSLAADSGSELSPAAVDRVRETLHAVALDEAVRRDFERQRLTTDHAAVGLGGFSAGAGTPAKPARKPSAKDDARQAAKRLQRELKTAESEAKKLDRLEQQAEREATHAREAAERAQDGLERAAGRRDEAAAAAAAARERVAELRKSAG